MNPDNVLHEHARTISALQAQQEGTNQALSDFNDRLRKVEARKPVKIENDWPMVVVFGLLLMSATIITIGVAWLVTS